MSEKSPNYQQLDELLSQISGQNGRACQDIYQDYKELFHAAPGSSHNHQAWKGGYYDHVTEVMNITSGLYDYLNSARPLSFQKAEALTVMFLHDLEKPFKYELDEDGEIIDNPALQEKSARAAKRNQLIGQYAIDLNDEQLNAMKYVEGVRDSEYTPGERTMGEMAALCHSADTLSARLWHDYPLPKGDDPWPGAGRISAD